MNVVQNAYVVAIKADSYIASQISTYGGEPSVFARRPVPGDVTGMYITVGASKSDTPYETKTTLGREVISDIGVYVPWDGDPGPCDEVAEYIRDLFNRTPLAVSGYGNSLIAVATGPIDAPTDDRMYGRIVTVRQSMIRA